ncbi:MAG: hypothetical protein JNM57_12135 [Cyclobacteriaceae bacterium]|nr:hypothetical protein [Cyclobacteriaceae bacterium]
MMKRFLFLSVFLVTLSSSYCVVGQSFYSYRSERDLILTAGFNTSTYYGDLKDNSDYLDAKPSISLGAMYYFYPRIAARAEFSWVTFSGDDADSKDSGKIRRNLSFKSSNIEFSTTAVINLIPTLPNRRFYQRPKYNAYGFVGIGGLYFNPKAELDGTKYNLKPLQTEGVNYSRFTFIIPYGIGGRLQIDPFFNIAVEMGWRKTFSDYIDDVSTKYIDHSASDPITQQLADRRPEIGLPPLPVGAKRGDPSKKDAYMLLSVKVEYYLPFKVGLNQRKLYNTKRKSYYKRRR